MDMLGWNLKQPSHKCLIAQSWAPTLGHFLLRKGNREERRLELERWAWASPSLPGGSASCQVPQPQQGCSLLTTCLPGSQPHGSCPVSGFLSLSVHVSEHVSHSSRALPKWGVSKKWSRDHRISPGTVMPKPSRQRGTVNWHNLGTRHSLWNPPPALLVWFNGKVCERYFSNNGAA